MGSGLHNVSAPAELGRRSVPVPPRAELEHDFGGDHAETSIFDFATVVLRNTRWLVVGMLLGGAVALLPLLWLKREYRATASFSPQGTDAPRSGLTALAGQFGIAVGGANQNQSPQFYADLVRSRVILEPFAQDAFTVQEQAGQTVPFARLFGIPAASDEARGDAAVAILGGRVQTKVNATTGTVTLTVTTPWRSVSVGIAQRLLDRLNAFNLEQRQSQASNERRFIEGRLAEAREALRAAEDRLEVFLASNRQLGSALLTMARDRLQREVSLRQSVVSTLTQSYEDVRIREVRDTPVITVIEPPDSPIRPVSRRGALRLVVGVMLGGLVALMLTLVGEMFRRRRAEGDPDVEEFVQVISNFRNRVFRRGGRRNQARV
jgi:uncharacterized protein involved in exopolysaccharide biosynthesis